MRSFSDSAWNCFGVDLNRNFDIEWQKIGSSKSICSEVYAGASANSEFETVAITNFMLSKKPYWLSYISIHAFGAFWLHDWKDSISEDPNYNEEKFMSMCTRPLFALKKMKDTKNYNYEFGIPFKLLDYDASGTSDIWASNVLNITYSYTIELGPNSRELLRLGAPHGFHVDKKYIKNIVETAYIGLYEYLRYFIEPTQKKIRNEIDTNCADLYKDLTNFLNKKWKYEDYEKKKTQ